MGTEAADQTPDYGELPLFPLGSVLFPGGLLSLKIFEARYLDLMARCLRERIPFGVVALKQGAEVRQAGQTVSFERVGVLAELVDCDSPGPGLMHVRCRGTARFERLGAPTQAADGLWVTAAARRLDDTEAAPAPEHAPSVAALQQAIDALAAQGSEPFFKPWRLNDAGWVANRWCELLPISMAARQKLMELDDALMRLSLVHDFLREHKVIEG
jgi:Lon protease-like protein